MQYIQDQAAQGNTPRFYILTPCNPDSKQFYACVYVRMERSKNSFTYMRGASHPLAYGALAKLFFDIACRMEEELEVKSVLDFAQRSIYY